MSGALDDLVIADFSRVLAGPFATMMLSDLGATVIKIERPGSGDETREWGPPYDSTGTATYFLSVNRDKHSIALDLRVPADLAVAREIIAVSDVVVENFRPGAMARLGLDYETLAAERPELVFCSITGFGAGAGAPIPAYDLLVQAVGGLMSITGAADGEPQKVGVALVDVLAGLFASVGILAALRHRERTGEGQRIEVSLLSSLLAALVNQASGFTAGSVVPARIGNAHPSIAPYELFPASGGELVIAVGNDRQFAALCTVVGAPELAEDPAFATNSERLVHRERLRQLIVGKLAPRTPAEWSRDLLAAGVPAGEVNDIAAAFRFAELVGLHPIVETPRAEGGAVRLVRNPVELSGTPVQYGSAPEDLDGGRDFVTKLIARRRPD